jgi:hypothetical protein
MSDLDVETDPRFPSGKWVGYYLDRRVPGRHRMEMTLTLINGRLDGAGRDPVGTFTFDGSYDLADGRCRWLKQYVGAHSINYQGFAEGNGIWGTWDLRWLGYSATGGFRIWPIDRGDSSAAELHEELDVPVETGVTERQPAIAPV